MTVYEMAKRYYPRLWTANQLKALLEAGRLTEEQYAEICGEE